VIGRVDADETAREGAELFSALRLLLARFGWHLGQNIDGEAVVQQGSHDVVVVGHKEGFALEERIPLVLVLV
jgi:hypothetical protein